MNNFEKDAIWLEQHDFVECNKLENIFGKRYYKMLNDYIVIYIDLIQKYNSEDAYSISYDVFLTNINTLITLDNFQNENNAYNIFKSKYFNSLSEAYTECIKVVKQFKNNLFKNLQI